HIIVAAGKCNPGSSGDAQGRAFAVLRNANTGCRCVTVYVFTDEQTVGENVNTIIRQRGNKQVDGDGAGIADEAGRVGTVAVSESTDKFLTASGIFRTGILGGIAAAAVVDRVV